MIIYKVTNTVNGKIYIGQTKRSIKRRWKGHITSSKSNKCNNLFHNAIKKHGEDSFNVEIIDHANSTEELNELEQKYIGIFNSIHPNGYNTKTGGRSCTYSDLSKKKMSDKKKGAQLPFDVRKKMSESHKLRWQDEKLRVQRSYQSKKMWEDDDYRKRISESRKKYWSEKANRTRASIRAKNKLNQKDVKDKISDGVKRAFKRDSVRENFEKAIKAKHRKIIDSNGKTYASIKDAAKQLGVYPSNICKVLQGKHKTCKGLTFRYCEEKKPLLYMVIGVSGSGKSWVCSQLTDKFNYIAYDKHKKSEIVDTLLSNADKPLLYDPVIGISTFINRNTDKFDIRVAAIVEDFITVKDRLIKRGGKLTKSIYNRYNVIKRRSDKYADFTGDSKKVLDWLKGQI